MKSLPVLVSAFAIALGLTGCGDRANPQAIDTIRLTPEQERDLFVGSGIGPDDSVIILQKVEKARYENGVIVLRPNGRVVAVVHPNAWRQYTGTAYSVEDAERVIARADRQERAVRDLGVAAADLRSFMDQRAKVASDEAARHEEDERQRHQKVIAASEDQKRAFAREVSQIDANVDARLAAVDKERDDEVSRVALAHGQRIVELSETWAKRERELTNKQKRDEDDLTRRLSAERQAMQASNQYRSDMESLAESQVNSMTTAHKQELTKLNTDREAEIAAQREATNVRIADIRRIYAAKADRARQEGLNQRKRAEDAAGLNVPTAAPAPAPVPASGSDTKPVEAPVAPVVPATKGG